MERAREGWRWEARRLKGRGEAGTIGILLHRQETTRWTDDPVQIHYGRRLRGCWGIRGTPPLKVHRVVGKEGRSGQE